MACAFGLPSLAAAPPPADPFGGSYAEFCSVCHGDNMQGAAQGPPLAGVKLKHGDSIAELMKSIANGNPQASMPAWSATMDDVKIRFLAAYISEKRAGYGYTDFKVGEPPALPAGNLKMRSMRSASRLSLQESIACLIP